MWGRGYYRPQQQTTGWDALAQIVGAISQRNQEKAQADALTNMNFDTPTDTRLNTAGVGQGLLTAGQQFNSAPQQYGIDQAGLLSGKQPAQQMPFTPSLMPQQAPQPSLMQTNQRPEISPFQKALNARQPQPATVSPTVQQPREYRTTQEAMRDFQPQMRIAVMNLVKAGYSAKDAFQIASQKANELAGIRVKETQDKYASQADDELMQAFGSSDPRTILKAAAKHKSLANRYGFQGADMQLVAQAIKMGAKEFVTQQENGENVTYARTPDGQMTEVHRSKPGITQYQQATLDGAAEGRQITREGQAIRATNYSRTGGTQADSKQMTNAKYVVDKHTAWVDKNTNKLTGELPDETKSPYYKYLGAAQQTLDGYYGIGGEQQSQAQTPYTGDSSIDSLIDAARARGASENQIAQAVQAEQAKRQAQPAQQPRTMTANFMGEEVQDAPYGYQVQLPQQIVPADEDTARGAWLNTLRR
jgi:hypothetical protein